jgi:hypothetical protein
MSALAPLLEVKRTQPRPRFYEYTPYQSGSRAAYFYAMHISRLTSNKYDRVPL